VEEFAIDELQLAGSVRMLMEGEAVPIRFLA
jgi:hypothetical protein